MKKYVVIFIVLFVFYYLFRCYFQPEVQNFTDSNTGTVSAQKAVDDVKKQLIATRIEASKIQKQNSQLIKQLLSQLQQLQVTAQKAVGNSVIQVSAKKAVDDVKKQLIAAKAEALKIQKKNSQLIKQLSLKVIQLQTAAKKAVSNSTTKYQNTK